MLFIICLQKNIFILQVNSWLHLWFAFLKKQNFILLEKCLRRSLSFEIDWTNYMVRLISCLTLNTISLLIKDIGLWFIFLLLQGVVIFVIKKGNVNNIFSFLDFISAHILFLRYCCFLWLRRWNWFI